MPRFPKVILAGLTLLAGPVLAQAPQPAPPPPPPPPASMMPAPQAGAPAQAAPAAVPMAAPQAASPLAPPQALTPGTPAAPLAAIDPKVTALFNQAIAAHQALSALSAVVTVSLAGAGPKANNSQTITLTYQKPDRAKVEISSTAGPVAEFLSDGKTLTLYLIQTKKYQVQPVPAGAQTIPIILEQPRALLPRLLGHPELLSELLAQPGLTASIVSPAFALPANVAGVSVDTVAVTLPAPDGSAAKFTFDFGKTDHLLRRIVQNTSLTSAGKTQAITLTQTVTALSTTPTLSAADFTFTPPPGVTKIAPATPKAGQAEPPMHDPRLVPGARPFPVTAKDLSGKPLSLAQYKGKVVLMDFWATWCGPCVGEMPNVIAAYKKYHAQGFDIVGISLDQSRPALTSFIAQNRMPWRQVFDGKYWSSAVPREYGVQAIPFGLLIGRDGMIAAVDVRGPALTAAIKEALAK